MTIKKYQVFVKVTELGSLTKAAESLGLTQSGVSHILTTLEDEMGFSLMRRNRSGIQLTDEGERLLPAMRRVLNCNEQLNELVAAIRGLECGTVRIGAFTSVAVHWLPGMIKDYQQNCPNIDFRLLNGDYHDIEQWLTDGSIDLGFVTLPGPENCECYPLLEERLLAILPPDHPLATADFFPLSQIPNESFISLLETSDSDARRAMDKAHVKPKIKFTTKDDYAIIAMVENGLGISILPALLLEGHSKNVKALELVPAATRTIALAMPESSKSSPITRNFAEFVRGWIKQKYVHRQIEY